MFSWFCKEKDGEEKEHIYHSLCSGLMMEEFHKRSMDSAENLHDNFIQLFLMPDQLLL